MGQQTKLKRDATAHRFHIWQRLITGEDTLLLIVRLRAASYMMQLCMELCEPAELWLIWHLSAAACN